MILYYIISYYIALYYISLHGMILYILLDHERFKCGIQVGLGLRGLGLSCRAGPPCVILVGSLLRGPSNHDSRFDA